MKKLIVILAAIAMVGAFAVTTMAAEWNFYGSARMNTFWTSTDDADDTTTDASTMDHDLQSNARIGANVKFNDQISGRFEYGSGPNLRLLYGMYNFGDGQQILVGQAYTPSVSFYSNSVFADDGDLLGVGQAYRGRVPMIQWKVKGFKIALQKPNNKATLAGVDDGDPDTTDLATGTEVSFPQIEASYKYKGDTFYLDVYGGYQSYKEVGTTLGDQDVDSYIFGGGGGINFGPGYLKAGVHLTSNAGNYGLYTGGDNAGYLSSAVILPGGTEVIDNEGIGFLVVVGFKANDAITLEAGYGSESNELDTDGAQNDDTVQYYANLSYTITPGFFIVPEIGMYDYKNNSLGEDQGDMTYFGLKTQINF